MTIVETVRAKHAESALVPSHSGRIRPFRAFSWIVILITVGLILIPIGRLLQTAFTSGDGLLGSVVFVFTRPWLPDVLRDTVVVVVVSGVLAIIVASFFAWVQERTDASLGWFGNLIPLVPLILPQITVAIGWVMIATPRSGLLSSRLESIGVAMNLYSWPGIIALYTMSLTPFAYLIISAALRNLDPGLEEASRMSGASVVTTLRRISLPAILPAIGGAALLVLIQALSFYAIPSILGPNAQIDVLSVRIVGVVKSYPPDFATSAVLSLFLAAAIVPLWLVQRHLMLLGQSAKVGGRGSSSRAVPLGPFKWVARCLIVGYMLAASVLPLLGLITVSLQPFWSPNIDFATFDLDNFRTVLVDNLLTQKAVRNSVTIALLTGIATMAVAFIFALFIRGSSPRVARLVDGASKFPILFPHVAFGLAFLISFGVAPFNLSGTITLLVVAYIVMFMPQASIAANTALDQIGSDLEEAGHINGASRGRVAVRILAPIMLPGLVGGWNLVFILTTAEIAAAQMLSSGAVPVIGAVIYDIYSSGLFGALAAMGVIITGVSIVVIGASSALTRLISRGAQ